MQFVGVMISLHLHCRKPGLGGVQMTEDRAESFGSHLEICWRMKSDVVWDLLGINGA